MHRTVTTTEKHGSRRRRLCWAALVLAAALGLASCGDEGGGPSGDHVTRGVSEGGEPADPASEVARPAADFRAVVTPRADAVAVRYTFTNRGTDEVLLPDGGREPDGAAPAYVTGDGNTITISQRVFAQPDTDRKSWARAPQVPATRVAPGETVRAELRVPRPFVRSQPFGDDLGYGQITLPAPAADVRFCLGVLPAPYPVPVADQVDRADHAGPGAGAAVVLDHARQNAAAQYLFCTEPVGLGDPGAS